jgi:hypothetical protein
MFFPFMIYYSMNYFSGCEYPKTIKEKQGICLQRTKMNTSLLRAENEKSCPPLLRRSYTPERFHSGVILSKAKNLIKTKPRFPARRSAFGTQAGSSRAAGFRMTTKGVSF